MRLDNPAHRKRLETTLKAEKPTLLILDSFVRIHEGDENSSGSIAVLLGYLRELQRKYKTAILLTHHYRKEARFQKEGDLLRGSGDLHAWADSNIFIKSEKGKLSLKVEHRAARDTTEVKFSLEEPADGGLLVRLSEEAEESAESPTDIRASIVSILEAQVGPLVSRVIAKRAKVNKKKALQVLRDLEKEKLVIRGKHGYARVLVPVPSLQ